MITEYDWTGDVLISNLTDFVGNAEKVELSKRSNLIGMTLLAANWLAIFAIYYLVTRFPSLLTFFAAFLLLPGRQLGLSVLMHECAHRTLFRTRWFNDIFGHWLCALPVFNDLHGYTIQHMKHHKEIGTDDDPDLYNYAFYPVDWKSFKRKIVRDLTGRTGLRNLSMLFLSREKSFSDRKLRSLRLLLEVSFSQFFLFLIFWNFGAAWFYLIWLAVFMTTFMLVIRIRQVAEHGAVVDLGDPNPLKNTRTVDASFWQRWLFAPNGVNFHMEHHLLPSVPCYKLRAFRQKLRQSGALLETPKFSSYFQLMKHVISPKTLT